MKQSRPIIALYNLKPNSSLLHSGALSLTADSYTIQNNYLLCTLGQLVTRGCPFASASASGWGHFRATFACRRWGRGWRWWGGGLHPQRCWQWPEGSAGCQTWCGLHREIREDRLPEPAKRNIMNMHRWWNEFSLPKILKTEPKRKTDHVERNPLK